MRILRSIPYIINMREVPTVSMRLDLCQQDRLAERAESIVQSALLLKVTSCPGVNFDIAITLLPASADFSIALSPLLL